MKAANEVIERVRHAYMAIDPRPWVVGFSGGKDSSTLLQIVFQAIQNVPPSRRKRPIFVISNDTMVELPDVIEHVEGELSRVERAAHSLELPISCHAIRPPLRERFFLLLIGYGYPSPNKWFRWCTDRLKIRPTSRFVQQQSSQYDGVVILLGTRLSESLQRQRSMNKRGSSIHNFVRHPTLEKALTWSPIASWNNDDVWEYLSSIPSPWGSNNQKIVDMYRSAAGGECPMVATPDAPPCGKSRFGCWTCTVVERDHAMEGMIESGRAELEPMLSFRNWLATIRDEPEKYRMDIRRNGQKGWGPFKYSVREEILKKLNEVEEATGFTLIDDEEVSAIHRIWIAEQMTIRDSNNQEAISIA